MTAGAVVVLDVGKTMSKLSLWTSDGELVARQIRPNGQTIRQGMHVLDVGGITTWLTSTLSGFAGLASIEHIIPVAHGAAFAAVRDQRLVHLPPDYEDAIPRKVRDGYEAERDPFSITGSPALPDGLNLGVQLFRQQCRQADIFDHATLMPWAQYWAWFLSGTAKSEVTSLGCHTDLWAPAQTDFSPMAKRLGWAEKFAPLAQASDVIGTIRPALAQATGLSAKTKVHCGLHDSNAALLAARAAPEINGREITVLSTGTWFVAMRTPAKSRESAALPAERDCLVNVDVLGTPVPSARFMGGREIELLSGNGRLLVDSQPYQPALMAQLPGLIARRAMLLPTFAKRCGPFPSGLGRKLNVPVDEVATQALACLYAALVADVSLDLIGAKGCILVEGRFSGAEVFVRALASLRPADRIYVGNPTNDVSFGAVRLIHSHLERTNEAKPVAPLDLDLMSYKQDWLELAEAEGRDF